MADHSSFIIARYRLGRALGSSLWIGLAVSSCTFERPRDAAYLQISIPPSATRLEQSREQSRVQSDPRTGPRSVQPTGDLVWLEWPSRWDEFSCLGLHVSGAGVTPFGSALPSGAACSRGSVDLASPGLVAGLVSSRTGGTLSLAVPAGSNRRVQLFGIMTADGNCPDAAELFSALGNREGGSSFFTGAGDGSVADWPVLLASTTLNVARDVSVSLSPAFDSNNGTPLFCEETSDVRMDAALEVMSLSLQGAPLAELLAEREAHVDLLSEETLDFTFEFDLRLDRRIRGTLAASQLALAEGTALESADYRTLAVTRQDPFTYRVQGSLSFAPSQPIADFSGLRLRLATGAVTDLYGRPLPGVELDLGPLLNPDFAEFWAEFLGDDAGDPDGDLLSLPQLDGFYFIGDDPYVRSSDELYASGECGPGIASLRFTLVDSSGVTLVQTTPCPSAENGFSGLEDGHTFSIEVLADNEGYGLAEGTLGVIIEGLDEFDITIAEDTQELNLNDSPEVQNGQAFVSSSGTLHLSFVLHKVFDVFDMQSVAIEVLDSDSLSIHHQILTNEEFVAAMDEHSINVFEFSMTGVSGAASFAVTFVDSVENTTVNTGLILTPAVPIGGKLATGDGFNCYVSSDDRSIRCTGNDTHGQLGRSASAAGGPTSYPSPTPMDFPELAGPFPGFFEAKRVSGSEHYCSWITDGTEDKVVCWGTNWLGQLGGSSWDPSSGYFGITYSQQPVEVPLMISGISDIAATSQTTCVLDNNGSGRKVHCWGVNSSGQLGLGHFDHSPGVWTVKGLDPTTDLTGVNVLAAGSGDHFCAAGDAIPGASGSPTSRTVCWGVNNHGKLGLANDPSDAATQKSASAIEVSGLPGGEWVTALALGYGHSCALMDGGEVYCWGANNSGQLGDNQVSHNDQMPTAQGPVYLGETVLEIAATDSTTCARLLSGEVKCWGQGTYGEAGNGGTAHVLAPASPVIDETETPIQATQIAAGSNHFCAITDPGTSVSCWGLGANGQLGRSASLIAESAYAAPVALPVIVVPEALHLFRDSALLMNSSGPAYGWGGNSHYGPLSGRVREVHSLGDSVPLEGLTPDKDILQLVAGNRFACARDADGTVHCWGLNSIGQLGSGLAGDSASARPIPADRLPGAAVSIAAVGETACAALDTGAAYCWGSNWAGFLGGNASGEASETPVQVKLESDGSPLEGISQVGLHGQGGCALAASTGKVFCWGYRVVEGEAAGSWAWKTTGAVEVISSGATELAMGSAHACVRLGTSAVKCWGQNGFGRAAPGSSEAEVTTPTLVSGLVDTAAFEEVLQISAGQAHSCALVFSGATGHSIRCWGDYRNGQLGDGLTTRCDSNGENCDSESVIRVGPVVANLFSDPDQSLGVVAVGNRTCSIAAQGLFDCTLGSGSFMETVEVAP